MDADDESISQVIDRIAVALGQRDFAHMRQTISKIAPFLRNLSRWAEAIGRMPPEEYKALVEAAEEANRESAIRRLTELEDSLPRFRIALVRKLEALAPSLGGRLPEFQDRATERKHCKAILDLIASGKSESEAVQTVAKDNGVVKQTMEKTWAKRSFIAELSPVELVDEVIAALSRPNPPDPEDYVHRETTTDPSSEDDPEGDRQ
jgi:hypothetical protein